MRNQGPEDTTLHFRACLSASSVAHRGPRGDLMGNNGEYSKQGTRKHVAMHRHNNNTGQGCHLVSFGETRQSIPKGMTFIRCSPGHGIHVNLIICTGNTGGCVLLPRKLGINDPIFTNRGTRTGSNGYLPLHGVPVNFAIRGVRVAPKSNNGFTHDTNASTRFITGGRRRTALGVPSNRMHVISLSY